MRRVIFATLSTIVGLIMLLSFKTHTATSAAVAPSPAVSTPGASPATSNSATGGAGSATTTPSSGSGSGTKTITGSAAQTRYGPVQVRITVANGQITSAQAVEYPRESPRDSQINSYAIPRLNQEAAATKSANIDMVSGATYTSDGYISSLQSAMNQAGLS
jgi:uncharacterized protein with FMN-binding domain